MDLYFLFSLQASIFFQASISSLVFFCFPFMQKKRISLKIKLYQRSLSFYLKMDLNRNRTTLVKGAAFQKQAREHLQTIMENFTKIIELMKVEEVAPNQIKEQLPRSLTNTTEDFEMRVRAQNMVCLSIRP